MGGGFTGLFTALHLSHHKYPKTVTSIDRNDRFSFNPMMYEYLSGEMGDEQVYPRYLNLLEGKAIADNLIALAKGKELSEADVSLRGTLLKLGLGESEANLFDRYQIKGKVGHTIRSSTYLTLLPIPYTILKPPQDG